MTKYQRIELSDLTESSPQWVELRGIARAPRREEGSRSDKGYVFYVALLQSEKDPNVFAHIYGRERSESGLAEVLTILGASSETNIPVIIKGQNGTAGIPMPRLNLVDEGEIRFGNLVYQLWSLKRRGGTDPQYLCPRRPSASRSEATDLGTHNY